MVTAGVIRELFEAVVDSYREDIRFFSRWSEALDTVANEHNPKVLWRPPTVDIIQEANGTLTQSFTIAAAFLDQTAMDRTTTERDLTYERMQVVAAHIWAQFHNLYIKEEATYQGVYVSLMQASNATFTAIWDAPAEMTTGCALTVTVSSPYQFCAEDYFNA